MCVRACVRVRAHSCESDFDSVTCERGVRECVLKRESQRVCVCERERERERERGSEGDLNAWK